MNPAIWVAIGLAGVAAVSLVSYAWGRRGTEDLIWIALAAIVASCSVAGGG